MYTTNRPSRGAFRQNKRRTYSNAEPRRGSFQGKTHRPLNKNGRGGAVWGGRRMPAFDPSQFINTAPPKITEEVFVPKHTFGTFGLSAALVRAITSVGLVSPTPIQDRIIPEILSGRDVIGLAETGTGKTAAFLIPLIEKALGNPRRQTLILTPTRELAVQIQEELRSVTRAFRLHSVTCVGGMNIHPQINAIRRTNHFVIGTPGRILDLIKRKDFKSEKVTTVVLDEADRMLDMGFIHDIRMILATTPKERETLLFSATFNAETKKLANDFLREPITVSVKKKEVLDTILQDVVPYEHHSKFETLTALLENPDYARVLIFGSMKHSVQKLAHQLSGAGISSDAIHGNKSHHQRQQALKRFKGGVVRVLVATDVAARGIHVEHITHVINYDLPGTFEDYIHRIGRTGRAANSGKALTFVLKR